MDNGRGTSLRAISPNSYPNSSGIKFPLKPQYFGNGQAGCLRNDLGVHAKRPQIPRHVNFAFRLALGFAFRFAYGDAFGDPVFRRFLDPDLKATVGWFRICCRVVTRLL
jgi:hypothetical protein